jgi:hypothetical protein
MEKVPPYWGFETNVVVGEVVLVLVVVVGEVVLVLVVVVAPGLQDTRTREEITRILKIGKMYLPFIVPPYSWII